MSDVNLVIQSCDKTALTGLLLESRIFFYWTNSGIFFRIGKRLITPKFWVPNPRSNPYSNRFTDRCLPYRADSWLLFVIAVPESDHFKAHRLLKNSETNIGYLYLTKHTYLSCNVIFHSAVK